MTTTKAFHATRAAAEAAGATWVGPGSAWYPPSPPPREGKNGRVRAAPGAEAQLRAMIKTQPAIGRAAATMLRGKALADGTRDNVESVASILARLADGHPA